MRPKSCTRRARSSTKKKSQVLSPLFYFRTHIRSAVSLCDPLHGQLPGRWRIPNTSLKSSWSRPILQTPPLSSLQTKYSTNRSICAPPHLIRPPKTPEPSDACNASVKMQKNIAARNPSPYRRKRNAFWAYMTSQIIRGNMLSMSRYTGCG